MGGMFSWLVNLCSDSCMACVVVIIGLVSLVCSWDAGCVSVVASSVVRANARLGCGRGLICPLSVILRVLLLCLVLGVVFDPLLLFVILLVGSSRLSPLPKGEPSDLGVCLRIVEAGIWFGFLWCSLLFVVF